MFVKHGDAQVAQVESNFVKVASLFDKLGKKTATFSELSKIASNMGVDPELISTQCSVDEQGKYVLTNWGTGCS